MRVVIDLIVIAGIVAMSMFALEPGLREMITGGFQPHFFGVLGETTRAAARVWAFWGLATAILGAILLRLSPTLGTFDAALGGGLGVWVFAYIAGNVLGPVGLLHAWTLWSLLALGVIWVWRSPPAITWDRPSPGQWIAVLAFALVAPTMFVLQLASPLPPYMDVFSPTAAAQRIVTFGVYLPFDNNPYGYYPPLGQIPGTELFYAFLALGTGTRLAVLAETATILPLTALLVFGMYRLGKSVGGDLAGGFASLLLFATVLFRVIPTGHGRHVAFVLVAGGLAFILDPDRHPLRLTLGALILGTAVASHAIIGTFGMMAFAGVALCWLLSGDLIASIAAVGLLAGASLIALPAVAVGLNLDVPYPSLPLLQIIGIAVIASAARLMPRREPRESRLLLILVTFGVGGLILWHPTVLEVVRVHWLSFRYPILWIGGVLGLVVTLLTSSARQRAPVVMLVAAGLFLEFVGVSGQKLASHGHVVLGLRDLSFKVDFWYPFALVVPAACLAAWLATYLPRRLVLYAVLAVLCYPWRYGETQRRDPNMNQHSIIEGAAEHQLLSKWGYWGSTGHRRWAQTDAEMTVIHLLRGEIAAGRITTATHIAHLSPFIYLYQDVVLFSVYTGINDDLFIDDYYPDASVVGGRMRPIETFPAVLAADTLPPYIVIHSKTINNSRLKDVSINDLDLHAYETLFNADGVELLRLKTGEAKDA